MSDLKNKKIDGLLRQRIDGLLGFAAATSELIQMGVKINDLSTGQITLPANYAQFLHKYERSNLEFEWRVTHTDGSKLEQFDELEEHHFGHIQLDRLKLIQFISNFAWPTDNLEKRVVITLDFSTGLFDFMNGFASQEVRAALCEGPQPGIKKLILFARKRHSSTVGSVPESLQEFIANLNNEQLFYNRFVLGYELPDGTRRGVIISPNGQIELWNGK